MYELRLIHRAFDYVQKPVFPRPLAIYFDKEHMPLFPIPLVAIFFPP